MGKWTRFNSGLLEKLQKEGDPPFYQKLMQLITIFRDQKSLDVALKSIFQGSETPVAAPSLNNLKRYGQLSLGGKTEVLMYLENALFDLINDSPEKLTRETLPRNLDIKDLHPTIQKYMLLIYGLSGVPVPIPLSVDSVDEIAFAGLMGLIETAKGKELFHVRIRVPYRQNPMNQHIPIESTALQEMAPNDGYQSEQLRVFERLNQSELPYLKVKPLKIDEAIPYLLSQSSFLWGSGVFNLREDQILAMNEGEKALYLLENQAQGLEAAMDFLAGSIEGKEFAKLFAGLIKEVKFSASVITGKLKAKKDVERLYLEAGGRRKNFEKRFQVLQQELGAGAEEMIPPIEMLQLYATRGSQPFNFSSPIGRLVSQTMEGYKRALFDESALKEDLSHLENNLMENRKTFEDVSKKLLDWYFVEEAKTTKGKNALLSIYTYLSMIFLNEEIFPEASIENLEKRSAKVKANVKRSIQKWKRFTAKKRAQRESSLEEDTLFQGMLDARERVLYSEYFPLSSSYRYKELSPEDLRGFAEVSEQVVSEAREGRLGALKKFKRLKGVLEKTLNENNAFLSLAHQYQGVSRGKVASMTAYIEAAKIFASEEDPYSFSKVMETIFQAITKQGLKESALKSSEQLLASAKDLSVVMNPAAQQLESTLDNVVRRIQGEAAQDFDIAPALSQRNDPELSGMKEEVFEKARAFKREVFAPGTLWDYDDIYDILKRNIPKNTAPLMISREQRSSFKYPKLLGRHETIEDAYDAIRSIWKMVGAAPYDTAKKREAMYHYSIKEAPDVLAKALYIHRLMEEIDRREALVYQVVPRTDFSRTPDKIDIFSNQSLFKFYEGRFVDQQKNQRRAGQAYNYFLPVFVANFTAVENRWGAEGLREAKLKLIESLPDARTTFQEIERWRAENGSAINNINEWILKEIEKNTASLQNDPTAQVATIERLFKEGMRKCEESLAKIEGAAYAAYENALYSGILGVGVFFGLSYFGILSIGGIVLGGIPTVIATVIFSFLGGSFLYNKGIDFAKTAIESLLENMSALLGMGNYNLTAPADMLMTLMESALTNEIHSMDKFKSLQHKMNYAFYIQEFFNVVEQMQTDLTTFRDRAASLLPYMAEQANFSVMGCNMFCMLSKDVFLRVSPDLMRRSQHPLFTQAIKEYLSCYKSALQNKAEEFQGDPVFLFKSETPFSRFMRNAPLYLEFPVSSFVGRVFGEAKIFTITTDQILPFDRLSPAREAQQLNIFLERGKTLLDLKELFDRKLQRILMESHNAAQYEKPLSPEWLLQAKEGLTSSMEMLSFAFQQAYETRGRSMNPYLQATGESPETIFSGKLFRDSLSLLQKTADFGKGLGLESGIRMKALLDEITHTASSFLKTGVLYLPPFEVWSDLKEHLGNLLQSMANGYPSIGYPILLEFVENKGTILPQLIWLFLKGSLGTEGSLQITEDGESKLTYLTGQNLEIFTSNPESRNFFLTPYMINAFEKAIIDGYTNPELLNFLGRNEQTAQEIRQISQSPMTRWLSSVRPEERPLLEGPQRAYGETYFGAPAGASNMVNPAIGLAPRQYDLDNIGIAPQEALGYYGNRLDPQVQEQLQTLQSPQGQALLMPPQREQIPGASSQEPPVGLEQPAGQPMGTAPSQRQNTPSQENPLLMPLLMPQGEMMEQQALPQQQAITPETQQVVNAPQLEAVPQEAYAQPQRVPVGGSMGPSASAPSQVQMLQPVRQPENPPMPLPVSNAGPIGRPSFPPPAEEVFVNPSTQGYNPEVPAQGWGWQEMAGIGAIGAGAALGAALLAKTTRDNMKKKRSRGGK